jgi:hypothetical protein
LLSSKIPRNFVRSGLPAAFATAFWSYRSRPKTQYGSTIYADCIATSKGFAFAIKQSLRPASAVFDDKAHRCAAADQNLFTHFSALGAQLLAQLL